MSQTIDIEFSLPRSPDWVGEKDSFESRKSYKSLPREGRFPYPTKQHIFTFRNTVISHTNDSPIGNSLAEVTIISLAPLL